ncbi:GNAT family N-acetyltransferase [Brachybacterium paraconglomeratum]|uniref:GNAT family N-acetyltransferase n=1 Tax=Brachybacterium paraconglomeratum TaxID=173362 RepID=UPI0037C6B585
MPVRELTPTDALAYRLLTSSAFGGSVDPDDPAASAPLSPGQTAVGIDSAALPGGAGGVLAAAARIRHDEISLGGGRVRCGGIAGLAVHPAHRGDGLFAELLAAVLARCDEESLPVSMLYPSTPEIYRRHGYQVVARVETLEVPLVDLQRLRSVPGRRTVPVTAASMPRVRALYEELTAGDNAMLRRQGPLFPDGLPGHGWEAVLLVGADGLDRGYASWTRRRGEGPGLEVHEVLGRDREDLRALLRVIGSWSTVTESVRLRVRTEDPVLDVLPGGGARPAGGTVPLVMMRVVDTAALLTARPAPAGSPARCGSRSRTTRSPQAPAVPRGSSTCTWPTGASAPSRSRRAGRHRRSRRPGRRPPLRASRARERSCSTSTRPRCCSSAAAPSPTPVGWDSAPRPTRPPKRCSTRCWPAPGRACSTRSEPAHPAPPRLTLRPLPRPTATPEHSTPWPSCTSSTER